jgi:hypothetical protein
MQEVLLMGLWVLLIAAAVTVGVLLPRRRSRTLQHKASALGFTYHATSQPFRGTRADELTILEDGAFTEVENVLERTDDKFQMFIFDEQVASDTAAVPTTFAAFRAGVDLPIFQIGERNLLERMEEALGKKVLKVDCDANFAAHFFVQCADEDRTRTFLATRNLAAVCQHAKHFHVESSPDWLLIYRPDVTVGIDGVAKFAAEATAVAEALLTSRPMPLPASA